MLFEIALQPPRSDPRMTWRILPGDQQREVERVEERKLRQLPRGRDGGNDVPPLDRALEDRIGAALRGDRCSLPRGRDGDASLPDRQRHFFTRS